MLLFNTFLPMAAAVTSASTTELRHSNESSVPMLPVYQTCNDIAIAHFVPENSTQAATSFKHYLQQPVCHAPPHFMGLDPRNRFEEDYQRFSMYFNKNYDQVPTVCKERFEKVDNEGKIPELWDDYVRKERESCKNRKEHSHTYVGNEHEIHINAAPRALTGFIVSVAVAALAGQVFGWVML